MANIIDYIKWRGDIDFDASPFNSVDNLILSELSYMNFTQILKTKKELTISDIALEYLDSEHDNDLGLLLTGEFNLMLSLMADSRRFGHLMIKECIEEIDHDVEVQFFAMTIELNKGQAYIAFRGTDDTLVGWKEDFKMSFLDEVPAQKKALEYINMINSDYTYENLYIGGHSKGGNLAVYASMNINQGVQDKIISIYNNDGPGFKQSMIDTDKYKKIDSKIITLIPQSSVVGMMLEHEETYQVVKSTQKGLLQHDGFSWEVIGPDFEYLVGVDDDCKMVDMALKKVLNTMSLEERESFTNIMFEIISVNENRTLIDIKKDGLKSLYTMTKNYGNLDRTTKKALHEMNLLFFDAGFRSFLEVKDAKQWRKKLFDLHNRVPNRLNKMFNKKDLVEED